MKQQLEKRIRDTKELIEQLDKMIDDTDDQGVDNYNIKQTYHRNVEDLATLEDLLKWMNE